MKFPPHTLVPANSSLILSISLFRNKFTVIDPTGVIHSLFIHIGNGKSNAPLDSERFTREDEQRSPSPDENSG
jgi:hypothetical protein